MFVLRNCVAILIVASFVVTTGRAGAAVLIDNFEQGGFSIMSPGAFAGFPESGLSPANVIGGARDAVIESTDGLTPVTATLATGAGDDAVVVATGPATASRLQLFYGRYVPLDFDAFGTGDRFIVVSLRDAAAGGVLSLNLSTLRPPGQGANSIAIEKPVTGPGDYLFSLDAVPGSGVSLANIDLIRLELRGMTGGYAVTQIALVPEPAFILLLPAAMAACLRRRRT